MPKGAVARREGHGGRGAFQLGRPFFVGDGQLAAALRGSSRRRVVRVGETIEPQPPRVLHDPERLLADLLGDDDVLIGGGVSPPLILIPIRRLGWRAGVEPGADDDVAASLHRPNPPRPVVLVPPPVPPVPRVAMSLRRGGFRYGMNPLEVIRARGSANAPGLQREPAVRHGAPHRAIRPPVGRVVSAVALARVLHGSGVLPKPHALGRDRRVGLALAGAREPVLHRARDDAAVRRGAAVRTRGIGEHRRDVRVCAREPAGLLPPARAAGGLLLLLLPLLLPRGRLDGRGGAPTPATHVSRVVRGRHDARCLVGGGRREGLDGRRALDGAAKEPRERVGVGGGLSAGHLLGGRRRHVVTGRSRLTRGGAEKRASTWTNVGPAARRFFWRVRNDSSCSKSYVCFKAARARGSSSCGSTGRTEAQRSFP